MSDHIAVFALGEAGEFGLRGGLPWGRIKEDMKIFREHTMGRVVVCGPKTFKSMGPLKGRTIAVSAMSFHRIAVTCGWSDFHPILNYFPLKYYSDEAAAPTWKVACVGGVSLLQPGIQWRAFDELVISRIHGGPFECDVRMDWDFPGYECCAEEPVSERVTLTKWRKK
jgi:dihydrofolate reductase